MHRKVFLNKKRIFVCCIILLGWLLGGIVGSDVILAAEHQVATQEQTTKTAPGRVKERVRPGGPLPMFTSKNFVGSGLCVVCHDMLVDSSGADMSISNHWRSTMMANAAKDPLWQAKVSSEVKRNPALKEVIETKCATCHMPMAWTQAYALGQKQVMSDTGFLSPKAELHSAAMDGVSCSLCHQIKDYNLGIPKSFSGKFTVDTDKTAPDRIIYGPYTEPFAKTMRDSVGFTPAYGAHTNDSALCATCHTLFTPYVDGEGKVAGEFPEQTPYLEWKHSEFGVNADLRYDIGEGPKGTSRLCQECHMPHSQAGKVKIAKWAPPEIQEKDHFSQHHFVGGNAFMLNVLQDYSSSLNVAASTEKLEDTKQRTINQLQNESAGLQLKKVKLWGKSLQATLEVSSKVGHKFPTGFPSRNVWIHLSVTDTDGNVLFESGKPLPDGRIAGNNADEQPGSYEPHYDEITAADQVLIYETIMENTDGAVTYTLLRAAKYRKDNRLLPRGFDKVSSSADIAVYGGAAQDANFVGGKDEIRYNLEIEKHKKPYTLQARLLYQPISYNFMKDLEADEALPKVASFGRYYEKADKTPVTVAAVKAEIR